MADGYAASVHVVAIGIDAEMIAAIERLDRESFIELPEPDVADFQSVAGEEFRDREDRTDPHFLRRATRHRNASIDAERLETAPFRKLRLHQDARRSAVGKLAGVARRNRAAFKDRIELHEIIQRRGWTGALVAVENHWLFGHLAGRLVLDVHHRFDRNDLSIETPRLLGDRRPLLRQQGVSVLRIASDVVLARHKLCGAKHRHIAMRDLGGDVWIGAFADPREVPVLHRGDLLLTPGRDDVHAICYDLLGGRRHGHKARSTLAVHCLSGDRERRARREKGGSGEVHSSRARSQHRSQDEVFDLAWVDSRSLDGVTEYVRRQRRRSDRVQRSPMSLGYSGSRRADDDRFSHSNLLLTPYLASRSVSRRARPAGAAA